jgi:hypothetical protein
MSSSFGVGTLKTDGLLRQPAVGEFADRHRRLVRLCRHLASASPQKRVILAEMALVTAMRLLSAAEAEAEEAAAKAAIGAALEECAADEDVVTDPRSSDRSRSAAFRRINEQLGWLLDQTQGMEAQKGEETRRMIGGIRESVVASFRRAQAAAEAAKYEQQVLMPDDIPVWV